ncbi:hypothetical protein P389DRAFT_195679 [Cystobasidium minutum MCA 4210]|uniref:uncharacterized protein n=1 Tax=Cystobasidium minutum MCA 4210 TaxID=1397322 RepID=UPI0034CD343C|eukprot:jgi/Rhomi1/195679/gm1.3893_g
MQDLAKAPLFERQAVYWTTGAAAGIGALFASSAASNLSGSIFPAAVVNGSSIRHAAAGAGMRFLAFDLCRDVTKDKISTPALRGGIAGCVGGLAETIQGAFIQAVSTRTISPFRPSVLLPSLLSHGGTLFLCFGGYTLLSTSYQDKQPPSPFMTFFLGGLAGAFGIPVANSIRTQSLAGFIKNSAGGFVKVGTVIGLQVQASARLLEYLETTRLNR